MTKSIKDWVIEVGLDVKPAEAEAKKITRIFNSLAKVEGRHNKTRIDHAMKVLSLEKEIARVRKGTPSSGSIQRTGASSSIMREASKVSKGASARFGQDIDFAHERAARSSRLGVEAAALDKTRAKLDGLKSKLDDTFDPLALRRLKKELSLTNKELTELETKAKRATAQANRELARSEAQAQRAGTQIKRSGAGLRGPSSQLATGASSRLGQDIGFASDRAARMPSMKIDPAAIAATQNRLADLKNQLDKTFDPMKVRAIRKELGFVNKSMSNLERQAREAGNAIHKQSFAMEGFGTSFKHMARSMVSVFTIVQGAMSVIQTGMKLDSMKASLLATADTAEEAGDNFKFLKGEADRLGLSLINATGGFNRIAVAAKSVGFTTDQAREIFVAGSEASRTFGLDAQRTSLVMLAMSQMMS